MRRAKSEKAGRQKRPSSSLSPEAVGDLQLQNKDEVVVDMMEMKEKEELVMEEVMEEGQLVVAEPELHETNNKGGAEPHHQPSGIVNLFWCCIKESITLCKHTTYMFGQSSVLKNIN